MLCDWEDYAEPVQYDVRCDDCHHLELPEWVAKSEDGRRTLCQECYEIDHGIVPETLCQGHDDEYGNTDYCDEGCISDTGF